jgi:hypothetical protein
MSCQRSFRMYRLVWGPPDNASIMLVTLTVDGWPALPSVFPLLTQAFKHLNLVKVHCPAIMAGWQLTRQHALGVCVCVCRRGLHWTG